MNPNPRQWKRRLTCAIRSINNYYFFRTRIVTYLFEKIIAFQATIIIVVTQPLKALAYSLLLLSIPSPPIR